VSRPSFLVSHTVLVLHYLLWLPCSYNFFFHSLPLMVCVELFNFCERFRQTQSSGENVREFPSSCPNPNTTSEKETLHMWLHERKRRNLGWKDNTRMKTARPSILSHTVPLKTNLFQLNASHIQYANASGPCIPSIFILIFHKWKQLSQNYRNQ